MRDDLGQIWDIPGNPGRVATLSRTDKHTRTYRQTDRHVHHNTPLRYRGGVTITCWLNAVGVYAAMGVMVSGLMRLIGPISCCMRRSCRSFSVSANLTTRLDDAPCPPAHAAPPTQPPTLGGSTGQPQCADALRLGTGQHLKGGPGGPGQQVTNRGLPIPLNRSYSISR